MGGRAALYGKLEKGDKVALEAGNLAFMMAKEIIEWVGREQEIYYTLPRVSGFFWFNTHIIWQCK
jgi:hypothetical protein